MVALTRRLSGVTKALSLLSGRKRAPLRALLGAIAENLIGSLRTSKASPLHFPFGWRGACLRKQTLLGARVRFPVSPNFSVALSKRCLPDFSARFETIRSHIEFNVLDTTCDRLVS